MTEGVFNEDENGALYYPFPYTIWPVKYQNYNYFQALLIK